MSKRTKKTEVLQLSEVEKKMMRGELKHFRKQVMDMSMKQRLKATPFSLAYKLFNVKQFSPCKSFGRQLVLKIVDELLD